MNESSSSRQVPSDRTTITNDHSPKPPEEGHAGARATESAERRDVVRALAGGAILVLILLLAATIISNGITPHDDVSQISTQAPNVSAEQDLRLLGHVLDDGRTLFIAINKWDNEQAAVDVADRQVNLLSRANAAYKRGDKSAATELYTTAAGLGVPEAHFALASKGLVPSSERVGHYVVAAESGHEKALEYALDALFFRAADIRKADPLRALQLLRTTAAANPDVQFDERDVSAISMCAEAEPFDGAAFLQKYGIHAGLEGFYSVWELAEEAARNGRFGQPDAKLVLNLVCRGGFVPFEMSVAIPDVYQRWKGGLAPKFEICNFVSSRSGISYCNNRYEQEVSKQLTLWSSLQVQSEAWRVDGITVSPNCLETIWASGDNYEEYERQFPHAERFVRYPGNYWGETVPLKALNASWGELVQIPKRLLECNVLPDDEEIKVDGQGVTIIHGPNPEIMPNGFLASLASYKILAEWGEPECKRVMPNFRGTCSSLILAWVDNAHANYGKFLNTYAYIRANGVPYIVPVTNGMQIEDLRLTITAPGATSKRAAHSAPQNFAISPPAISTDSGAPELDLVVPRKTDTESSLHQPAHSMLNDPGYDKETGTFIGE